MSDELEPGEQGPDIRIPDRARKGRGAVSNRAGRFEAATRQAEDDGWAGSRPGDRHESEDGGETPLRTTVSIDTSRTAIAYNESPDIPFDRSLNPYRGCEHGCVYCFARPTHAWLGLSPGLDFETKLFAKPDAPELLATELARPGYRPAVLALGTNTDPYQPIERDYEITRRVLELLDACNHPVGIVTKSALVTRDIDILKRMSERRLAQVHISVTTLDSELARTLEPRAASPRRRLETIRALADAGIPVGVMAAPMIPALNDMELERILAAAKQAGAGSAAYTVLRLPLEIKDLFQEWLVAHAPQRARHVLALLRDLRGGVLNDSTFGQRMTGKGHYAELLARRFELARGRLGLNERSHDFDLSAFAPPIPPGSGRQLTLF
jgi:DNA repair photolyase